MSTEKDAIPNPENLKELLMPQQTEQYWNKKIKIPMLRLGHEIP